MEKNAPLNLILRPTKKLLFYCALAVFLLYVYIHLFAVAAIVFIHGVEGMMFASRRIGLARKQAR